MLPAAIPNARIMRFGYSSRYIGNEADEPIKQELSTVAAGLLQALRSKREADPKRPLVFIGHCFGGLVIQKVWFVSGMFQKERVAHQH
jgi:surfactin synthase thioesterase subunit